METTLKQKLRAFAVFAVLVLSQPLLAQSIPNEDLDYNGVKLAAEAEVNKYVSLETLVGSAGGVFAVNEPANYINSAFLVDTAGKVKNFIPANLLRNFASDNFDPSWEITTVGSGISDGVSSGGFIAANLEQTIFDHIFKYERGVNLSILFFNISASRDVLHRLSYAHRYNIDGGGLSDTGIRNALAAWVTHINADDTDQVVYVGNIGVREFKKEIFLKRGARGGISGWAYGAFGAVYEQGTDSIERKYVYTVDKANAVSVGTLKALVNGFPGGMVVESAGVDEEAPWLDLDMAQTRSFLDNLSGG